MTLVDAVIIVLVIGAAVSGYRQGLVTAMLSLVGAVGGAVVGVRLAPLLAGKLDDTSAKIAVGVALVVVGVGIGEVAGQSVGSLLTRRITWRPAVAVDRGLGLVGHALAVLVVTWVIAIPLATAPYPWLSSAIRSSAVLTEVNKVMPAGAAGVSSRLRQLFNDSGFPAILDPLAPAPDTPVAAPNDSLAVDPAVAAIQPSILKIRAVAPSCSLRMEGSGFVIGPGVVLTNAHVVAGSDAAIVEDGGVTRQAIVVLYDPDRDLAVLDVPGLTRPALTFADQRAGTGDDSVVAGYPLDGPFTLTPARVRADITLRGPNIYDDRTVTRDVYTLRAPVRPGNSGGPLLAPDGSVLGVVFGAAIDNPDIGFALTAAEVQPVVAAGLVDDTPAATGACSQG